MEDVELAVRAMIDVALENEAYFSDLDGVVGDADFGVSLATGFREIDAKWDTLDRTSIGHFFLAISQIITGKVGGCSGPIWGTAFMRAGIVARDKSELSADDIGQIFERAIDGIKARGGAEEGDKTLLDALCPMSRAFEAEKNGEPLPAVVAAAEQAVEDTRNLEARRGRQSFTGERSIGTLDPGCVAVATMTKRIAETAKQSA
ncbi:Phosphoenolpyruvate-dihydroxyacetone phosphotransferase, ADP-binding subunit DhaL [Aurantiacibacter gangjinensis]|nr:Phosphoenolpyruvate-dihydroxyacetone phosphotransferase, ADP-binding subunit DhaL [Aurantiacibacter gangjinensis]